MDNDDDAKLTWIVPQLQQEMIFPLSCLRDSTWYARFQQELVSRIWVLLSVVSPAMYYVCTMPAKAMYNKEAQELGSTI